MAEVELSQPLRLVPCEASRDTARYARAIVLVRLHSHPLGFVEIRRPFDATPADLARDIWRSLARETIEHLAADGWSAPSEPAIEGYSTPSRPQCLENRARVLAAAPLISVVVPTHERAEQLRAGLRSLAALSYPDYEVIVVDNTPKTTATETVVT